MQRQNISKRIRNHKTSNSFGNPLTSPLAITSLQISYWASSFWTWSSKAFFSLMRGRPMTMYTCKHGLLMHINIYILQITSKHHPCMNIAHQRMHQRMRAGLLHLLALGIAFADLPYELSNLSWLLDHGIQELFHLLFDLTGAIDWYPQAHKTYKSRIYMSLIWMIVFDVKFLIWFLFIYKYIYIDTCIIYELSKSKMN